MRTRESREGKIPQLPVSPLLTINLFKTILIGLNIPTFIFMPGQNLYSDEHSEVLAKVS